MLGTACMYLSSDNQKHAIGSNMKVKHAVEAMFSLNELRQL